MDMDMKALDLEVKNMLFVDRFWGFLRGDQSQRTFILQDFYGVDLLDDLHLDFFPAIAIWVRDIEGAHNRIDCGRDVSIVLTEN